MQYIESIGFEIPEVIIEQIKKEKRGGGVPPFFNFLYFTTRKPLALNRYIIASSLLDEEEAKKGRFIYNLFSISEKESKKVVFHHRDPIPQIVEKLKGKTLFDPFAGFGTIPLEALRLGLNVIASDFLPVNYIVLKAVLEFPEKGLTEKFKKYADELIKKLREDKDIKEIFDEEDVDAYLVVWEFKHEDHYTPLISRWTLLKGEGEEEDEESEASYGNPIWFVPVIKDGKVIFEVKEGKSLKKGKGKQEFIATLGDGQKVKLLEPNVDSQKRFAYCLVCGPSVQFRVKGKEWEVKNAIIKFNERLTKYYNGEISLEELKNSPARYRIAFKVKKERGEVKFEPCDDSCNDKLWKAFEIIKEKYWLTSLVPKEEIPPDSRISSWGTKYYYQAFNPLQLLLLIKTVEKVKELKIPEMEKEKILTYFSLAISKLADYNNLGVSWHPGRSIPRNSLAHSHDHFPMDHVALTPFSNLSGSINNNLNNIVEGLEYLEKTLPPERSIKILHADAREVKLDEKVDVIVTDPPYFDDRPYSEMYDRYYVWLKRVLSDTSGETLKPMYFKNIFFECYNDDCTSYNEIVSQWKYYAPKEISVEDYRSKYFGNNVGTEEDFKKKLNDALQNITQYLKDDGLILVYYNHTSNDAWISLVESLWVHSKIHILRSYAAPTDISTNMNRLHAKKFLEKSIILVGKKLNKNATTFFEEEAYKKTIKDVPEMIRKMISSKQYTLTGQNFDLSKLNLDSLIEIMGFVLSVFTSYKPKDKIKVDKVFTDYILNAVGRSIIEAVSPITGNTIINDRASRAYFLFNIAFPDPKVELLDKSDVTQLASISGININELDNSFLDSSGDGYKFLRPKSDEPDEIPDEIYRLCNSCKEGKFESPLDVVRYLEYKALTSSEKSFLESVDALRQKIPQDTFKESIALIKLLSYLKTPESGICDKIVKLLNK